MRHRGRLRPRRPGGHRQSHAGGGQSGPLAASHTPPTSTTKSAVSIDSCFAGANQAVRGKQPPSEMPDARDASSAWKVPLAGVAIRVVVVSVIHSTPPGTYPDIGVVAKPKPSRVAPGSTPRRGPEPGTPPSHPSRRQQTLRQSHPADKGRFSWPTSGSWRARYTGDARKRPTLPVGR